MDNIIGKYIGNYEVASEIARRDTVRVYQGRHCVFTDRLVVLKVFDVPPLSEQQHRSFAQAARQLERLKHPQILTLIDVGILEGKPYLVTAYAPNGSLRTYLSQLDHQSLPQQQAIPLLSQIGQALHAAHQQQIVHGNLKPENILFDAEHNACLTDFRLPVSPESLLVHQDESFTDIAYVAPEQLRGETLLQSDQYALGCLAYELLTGSPLLLDDSGATPKLAGGRTTILSSISSQVHLPAYMEEAICKAVQKEPEKRHISVFAFLAAIGAVTELPPGPTIWVAADTPLAATSIPKSAPPTHEPAADRSAVVRPLSHAIEVKTPSLPPLGRPRTIAREKMTAEQLVREGTTSLESWHYQEALSSYGQAIERDPHAAGAYSGKGDVLRELERLEEALSAYEEALRLDPNCAPASCGKGWILCGQKRYEEALTAFEQALGSNAACYQAYTGKRAVLSELGREELARATSRALLTLCQQKHSALPADAYFAQSLSFLDLDRVAEATRCLEQCIARSPGYLEAYERLGWLYLAQRNYERELAAWEGAILVNAEHASFHVRKASALLHLERYHDALDACEQALRMDPASSHAYYDKGRALLHFHRHQEALLALNQAIELSPEFVAAYACKADALISLKRHEEALATYDEVIRLTVDKWHYYWRKAELLASLACYEDAIATYDQFIELHPHDENGYLWKLFFLSDSELYEEGLSTCECWLSADSRHAQAYWWKGRMLTHLDRHTEALAVFDEAIQVYPRDHELCLSKARTLSSLKRYEEALQTYDQAIQAAPKKEKSEVSQEKAKLLEWLKRFEEALAVYQQIIGLAPRDASAHFQKGEILRHLDRAEEALEAYSRAIQLDSKFVRAYTARGKVLSGLERYEEALEMSEKALKLDPKSASAHFLREKALRALGKEEEAKAAQERGFDLLLSALHLHIGKANAQYERKQQKRRTAH